MKHTLYNIIVYLSVSFQYFEINFDYEIPTIFRYFHQCDCCHNLLSNLIDLKQRDKKIHKTFLVVFITASIGGKPRLLKDLHFSFSHNIRLKLKPTKGGIHVSIRFTLDVMQTLHKAGHNTRNHIWQHTLYFQLYAKLHVKYLSCTSKIMSKMILTLDLKIIVVVQILLGQPIYFFILFGVLNLYVEIVENSKVYCFKPISLQLRLHRF